MLTELFLFVASSLRDKFLLYAYEPCALLPHHRLLIPSHYELGKAGHVDQADTLPAHQVLVLDVIEELRLVKGALFRQLGWWVLSMVQRVKV